MPIPFDLAVTLLKHGHAAKAIWTELQYQNTLPLRDEATTVPAFLTLLRVYTRQVEDAWADNPGVKQPDGTIQVEHALHGLRKLAAISTRAMIYCGIREREVPDEHPAAVHNAGRQDR